MNLETTCAAGALLLTLTGCLAGGPTPDTTLYRLDVRSADPAPECGSAGPALVVEDLDVDGAYDDARITYRKGRYALSRYHYHRWSAAPGVLVADALRTAYQRTCGFSVVRRDRRARADVTLGGRVLRIEEVDASDERWRAELAVELFALDTETGRTIWTHSEVASVALEQQSPRGVADAMSALVWKIARHTSPRIVAAFRTASDSAVAAKGGEDR